MTSRFSVSLCTYNGAKFLPEQLQSISEQTRCPDELVVCDDQSTDSTRQIVEAFAANAPFPVKFYVNERNLGSTKNFEQAASLCSGDFIAFADQDDVWMPHKLEKTEAEFLKRPSVGLVFSDAELVDENLNPLGSTLWKKLGLDGVMKRRLTDRRWALDMLLPGWTVTGATMAFRSKFKSLALGIPADLGIIHDGWIALAVASVSDVALIEEPLIKYRQHAGQQIGAPQEDIADTAVKNLEDVRAALNRSTSYQQLIETGMHLRERLIAHSNDFDCDAALKRLDLRLAHVRMRAQLPKSRVKRLGPVLGELLSMRYYRYSKGIYSAVKDLIG